MVYMGSVTNEDPDDSLWQDHQMLASVHSGRSVWCHEPGYSRTMSFSVLYFLLCVVFYRCWKSCYLLSFKYIQACVDIV